MSSTNGSKVKSFRSIGVHSTYDLGVKDNHNFLLANGVLTHNSHSNAYAITAYACAYLKNKYPLEWWCAVLTGCDTEDLKNWLEIISPFIRFPHLSTSAVDRWEIVGDKIVAPLSLVRNIGEAAITEIKTQQAIGPFTSFENFLGRVSQRAVNKTAATNLVLAGCVDGLPVFEGSASGDVSDYLALLHELRKKKKDEPFPDEFKHLDRMKKIQLRSFVLPLATFSILRDFSDIIAARPGYRIDASGQKWWGTTPIFADYSRAALTRAERYGGEVCLIGLVDSTETFYYQDKKTKQKVGALRVKLLNDGAQTEIVIWPDTLAKVNRDDLVEGAMIGIYGKVKTSRFNGEPQLGFNAFVKLL